MPNTDEVIRSDEPYPRINARCLSAVCPTCTQSREWRPFHKWVALGKQVKKKEQATKIVVLKKRQAAKGQAAAEYWELLSLFCQHQVTKAGKATKRAKAQSGQ